MAKEELEKEAEEWLCNNLHSASEEDFIKAMVDIAEPREKQIQIDAEQIRALQKDKGELTDRVRKLEEKLEKETTQRIYNFNKSIEWKEKHRELKAQIEKMKCCYNCSKWKEGQCTDVPNDNSYYSADFVCEDWEIKENDL